MPWSITNTVPAMKGKSLVLRKLFAETANACLAKAQDEDSCIFAGLAAVRNAERPSKQLKQQLDGLKQQVPMHVAAVLNKQLLEPSEQLPEDLQKLDVVVNPIADVDIDADGFVVIRMKNGEVLKSKNKSLHDYIEQRVAVQVSPSKSSILNTLLVTTDYSLDATDYTIRVDCSLSDIVITLPIASSCTGQVFVVKKIDASNNAVNVTCSATDTIDAVSTAQIFTQYLSLSLQSNGATWDII